MICAENPTAVAERFPDHIFQCSTDAQRAMWLLSRPLAFLHSAERYVRFWLQKADFEDGLEYLDAELAQIRAERPLRYGPETLSMTICAARGRLKRVALGLPPLGM